MEMEMRCFLSAKDPVVLEREYSKGPISLDKCLRDSLSRDEYGPALSIRKIEQCRDVPTRDNAALANFELPGVDHGQRMFAFFYDLPFFLAARHAKVARISYGKFDHFALSDEAACLFYSGRLVPNTSLPTRFAGTDCHASPASH